MTVKQFSHNGRAFEVRAIASREGWTVRLFENNRQASALRYNLSREMFPEGGDQPVPAVLIESLMDLMQREVEGGRLRLLREDLIADTAHADPATDDIQSHPQSGESPGGTN